MNVEITRIEFFHSGYLYTKLNPYSPDILNKFAFLLMHEFESKIPYPLKEELVFSVIQEGITKNGVITLPSKNIFKSIVEKKMVEPSYTIRICKSMLYFVKLFDEDYFGKLMKGLDFLNIRIKQGIINENGIESLDLSRHRRKWVEFQQEISLIDSLQMDFFQYWDPISLYNVSELQLREFYMTIRMPSQNKK